MRLVVGLGNPGPRYAGARHNAGFRVVEILARRAGTGPFETQGRSRKARGRAGGEELLLVLPETFVNLSGEAVAEALAQAAACLADLLVICDDCALSAGALRLREKGGAGGHHGLESIAAALGSEAFARLRVGVGPAPAGDLTGFVLGPFSPEEEAAMAPVLERAAQAAQAWAAQGPAAAMNRFNRKI